MRLHFTISQRLALQLMAHLGHEFTDMESGPIRKERWDPWLGDDTQLTRRRSVHRVVSFKIAEHHRVPRVVEIKVSLSGWEHQALHQQDERGWTTWVIFGTTIGSLIDDRIVWEKLRIPDIQEESQEAYRFPHHLFVPACVGAVPSTDA